MKYSDKKLIIYDSDHWNLLKNYRTKAISIMKTLATKRVSSGIYGSVSRGDVHKKSDIDIIIPYVISSNIIELTLKLAGFEIFSRRIAQATPKHTPKAHLFLDVYERVCVTFPLVAFRDLELEFYRFGGFLRLKGLQEELRVPGCNKKLMLIEPSLRGHFESSIVDREIECARILGVGVEIVKERVNVLTRRSQLGRTGIILSVSLGENDVFEEVLKRVADSNPILRRRLRKK